jgi:hypothetical protein
MDAIITDIVLKAKKTILILTKYKVWHKRLISVRLTFSFYFYSFRIKFKSSFISINFSLYKAPMF